ncbi:MAG: ABC transporter ATP-binding protein [Candidatus Peribacteraceae bacterium]|nr:ABC transporter ATP-binding protein [Candidatus Peribacteraceae bacterium]
MMLNVASHLLPERTARQLRKLRELFSIMGVRPRHVVVPVTLSFVAALFAVVGLGLLIPIARGLAMDNFSYALKLPVLGVVLRFIAAPLGNAGLSDRAVLVMLIILFFLLQVTKDALEYASIMYGEYWSGRFANSITFAMIRRYLSFGKLFFDRESQGEINTTILYAQHVLLLLTSLLRIISMGLQICARVVVLLVISWKLTLVSMLVFPVLFLSVRVLIRQIGQSARQQRVLWLRMSRDLFNIFSSITLVKTYTQEEHVFSHFSDLREQFRRCFLQMRARQEFIKPAQELVITFFLVYIILYVTLTGIAAAETSILIVFLYIAIGALPLYSAVSASVGFAAEAKEPVSQVLRVFSDAGKHIVPQGDHVFGGLQDRIEYRDVWFSYLEDVPILQGLSFTVQKNTVVAIVGPSGTGKTTAVNLLLRLYDCPPSSILLDNVDIRECTHASLQRRIAYVTQEPMLFNDTLRANLQFGIDVELSDEALEEVLDTARLRALMQRLPERLNTEIGDRGVQLSGGEKQRLSIARALLKNAEILILDEATSSLDSKTEQLIQQALEDALRDRTAIVIAHRLSTIRNADKIVVMSEGRVAEEGTLAELLGKEGLFSKLWEAQQFF